MLQAISAVDGRYAEHTVGLVRCFSEFALIRARVCVELRWLWWLVDTPEITEIPNMTPERAHLLLSILHGFRSTDAERVKRIEDEIRHDVKAVEVWLAERLQGTVGECYIPWLHFACTSEDVNSVAYGMMIKGGVSQLAIAQRQLERQLLALAHKYAALPMLARTHGRPASPTTFGKELAVFVMRLREHTDRMVDMPISCKFSGAVGNFNAHRLAYPTVDWSTHTKRFIDQFQLKQTVVTTQIEPHDRLAELLDAVTRYNTTLVNLNRDMWHYISIGYIRQLAVPGEVGSSVMPHKVNPIDFENSEGNCGSANAVLQHLARTLPVSRMQRDLTDSTAMRNLGTGFAHSLIAVNAALRGVERVLPDEDAMARDLSESWEVLAEAVQTLLRRSGNANAYEYMRTATRGKRITREQFIELVTQAPLNNADRALLLGLTPSSYLGDSASLAEYPALVLKQ